MMGAKALLNMQKEVTNMITFMSYNSTGLNKVKCNWIQDICDKNDVNYLAIQEHFKSSKNTDSFFRDNFKNFNSYIIPGHRPPGQDSGRAKAGLAQLSLKEIAVKKDRVLTRSFRIQAQVLNLGRRKILWINSYLPTDPQTVVRYDGTDLMEVLLEVELLLSSVPHTDVVWSGDLNWEMSRNSAFSTIIDEFVKKVEIVPLWSQHIFTQITRL